MNRNDQHGRRAVGVDAVAYCIHEGWRLSIDVKHNGDILLGRDSESGACPFHHTIRIRR